MFKHIEYCIERPIGSSGNLYIMYKKGVQQYYFVNLMIRDNNSLDYYYYKNVVGIVASM
jgi:hypothetical protein